MDANNMTNGASKQSMFTVKKILRVLEIILIVFVFCPCFLVSCSGQDANVSVMTAVGGVSTEYGNQIVDPHPIMLICLLLPIVMLVVLFRKKIVENKAALITLICAVVDIIVWIMFKSAVKEFAEENLCSFKTKPAYVFNMIVLIIITILSLLVFLRKVTLNADLMQLEPGGNTQSALNQMSNAVTQMSSAVSQMAGNVANNMKTGKAPVIGYCQKCGSGIPFDCMFCTSCGTPVPEDMIKEAEEKKKAEEKARLAAEDSAEQDTDTPDGQQNSDRPMFCQKCGNKLDSESIFCEVCGTKID